MLIKLRSHGRRSLELWLHVLMVYEWIKMLLVISITITMMITISVIAVITVMWLQIHWRKWRDTISSDLRSSFGYQMTKWNFVIIIFNNVMVRWRSAIIMKKNEYVWCHIWWLFKFQSWWWRCWTRFFAFWIWESQRISIPNSYLPKSDFLMLGLWPQLLLWMLQEWILLWNRIDMTI